MTSENLVMELCEAGRFREARIALEGLDPDRHALAFGVVETNFGNQDRAKDFLSRAVREGAGDKAKLHLACAYWRSGELKEAKAILGDLPDCFEVLLLKAIIISDLDFHEALDLLSKAAKYDVSPGMQARLHNQRAMLLRKLGERDRAIQEYDAAIHYFQEAKSDCVPLVINNLVSVYIDCKQYDSAHDQIDRVIKFFRAEPNHLAKAYDQKAKIYLAENRTVEAERCARLAVRTIESTDKKAWLAECLLTHSGVLTVKGELTKALVQADRAEEIGQYLNDDQIVIAAATRKKVVAEIILRKSEIARIEAALRLTTTVRDAAEKLQLSSHGYLFKLMKRFGIERKARPRSIIK